MRYFKVIRAVVDRHIRKYATDHGMTRAAVEAAVSAHISKTQEEHFKLDPDIDYDDPLCRLGYLFRHAGANAYLFEQVLRSDESVRDLIDQRHDARLRVCAVGGGPGTELLGLVRYVSTVERSPRVIDMLILDLVQEWNGSWLSLADEATAWMERDGESGPIIAPSFQQMDVTDPDSYTKRVFLFERCHLVVFNYLMSENKVRMGDVPAALKAIVDRSPSGCVFVFIDRDEKSSTFVDDVRQSVVGSGLRVVSSFKQGGAMDGHPEEDLGDLPVRLGSRPRRWFRSFRTRAPAVFILVAAKD